MKTKLFAKQKPGLKEAINFIKTLTNDIEIYIGNTGDNFPVEAANSKCDVIISYISPWIIPSEILELVQFYAINFHPGPPEYPGIGCTNFAIYEDAREFGVTCHIMEPKVDTGKIISVKRFKIYETDSVQTLTDRCYNFILAQFYEVVDELFHKKTLSFANETWKRKPFTRHELNELSEIRVEMTEHEVLKRIKATYYPDMPYPFVKLYDKKFVYRKDDKC